MCYFSAQNSTLSVLLCETGAGPCQHFSLARWCGLVFTNSSYPGSQREKGILWSSLGYFVPVYYYYWINFSDCDIWETQRCVCILPGIVLSPQNRLLHGAPRQSTIILEKVSQLLGGSNRQALFDLGHQVYWSDWQAAWSHDHHLLTMRIWLSAFVDEQQLLQVLLTVSIQCSPPSPRKRIFFLLPFLHSLGPH